MNKKLKKEGENIIKDIMLGLENMVIVNGLMKWIKKFWNIK